MNRGVVEAWRPRVRSAWMAGAAGLCRRRALTLALLVSSRLGAQETIDPDIVQHATVGFSPGFAVTSAVSVTRTRQARFELPRAMSVGWRARVTAPVTLEPVVDDRGNMFVLHERGSLSSLDGHGKMRWSLRLGDAAPSVAPSILSDGALVVVNHDQRALRIDPAGTLLSSTPLGLKGKPRAMLPLVNGGSAIAIGDTVIQLDHDGKVVARTQARDAVLDLLQSDRGVLAVTESGEVYQLHGTGRLSIKGSFGARVQAVALASSRLFAVAGQQLMSLNLENQRARALFTAPAARNLQPWLALGSRAIYVAASDGAVRSFDPAGKELFRVVPSDFDVAHGAPALLPSNFPPPLADNGRQLMIARPGSETLVIEPDGAHRRIDGSACLSPTALVPLGGQSVLLACRNGELLGMQKRAQ